MNSSEFVSHTPHLKTETGPVSKTLLFSCVLFRTSDDVQIAKPRNLECYTLSPEHVRSYIHVYIVVCGPVTRQQPNKQVYSRHCQIKASPTEINIFKQQITFQYSFTDRRVACNTVEPVIFAVKSFVYRLEANSPFGKHSSRREDKSIRILSK
jgi:hypothetical protein